MLACTYPGVCCRQWHQPLHITFVCARILVAPTPRRKPTIQSPLYLAPLYPPLRSAVHLASRCYTRHARSSNMLAIQLYSSTADASVLCVSKTLASPAAGDLLKSLWRWRLQLASRIERDCESKVGDAKQQRNCARPDGGRLAWLQPFGLSLCTIICAARLRWFVRH